MEDKSKSFVYLHISVFLFGFTAILGDLISINYWSIVWWRSLLTVLILVFVINIKDIFLHFKGVRLWQQLFIGLLLGLHWIGFYGAIKIANPTIALIALSSSSLITALVEPLLNKSVKWSKSDIVFGILVIPGFILIFNNSSALYKTGLWIGLLSTFIGAVFSIYNKKWLVQGHEIKMTFLQLLTVFLLLSMIFAYSNRVETIVFQIPKGIDWLYFSIFIVFCTVISYYLYLKSMLHLNAFDISFAFNMEPIYGIVVAFFLLQDHSDLSSMVYFGMIFITLIVFLDLYFKLKLKR
jgi:drug/metabolite transporter (DMT)-like permease